VPGEQPGEVGAAAGSLFGGDAELQHEVVCGVGRWREHRHAEALDRALRVAFVPRRGEHDHRLADGGDLVAPRGDTIGVAGNGSRARG
jgi:hypothetical protein